MPSSTKQHGETVRPFEGVQQRSRVVLDCRRQKFDQGRRLESGDMSFRAHRNTHGTQVPSCLLFEPKPEEGRVGRITCPLTSKRLPTGRKPYYPRIRRIFREDLRSFFPPACRRSLLYIELNWAFGVLIFPFRSADIFYRIALLRPFILG